MNRQDLREMYMGHIVSGLLVGNNALDHESIPSLLLWAEVLADALVDKVRPVKKAGE